MAKLAPFHDKKRWQSCSDLQWSSFFQKKSSYSWRLKYHQHFATSQNVSIYNWLMMFNAPLVRCSAHQVIHKLTREALGEHWPPPNSWFPYILSFTHMQKNIKCIYTVYLQYIHYVYYIECKTTHAFWVILLTKKQKTNSNLHITSSFGGGKYSYING